ncbi:hypothetical protein FRC02_001016 [Tulasnella sp. 418]|nr:hypothetical protein FRC02_001016 [Tulasnella sp. 418]
MKTSSICSLRVIFPSLLLGKLVLLLSPLPELLRNDHQLTSPLTSFSRLKEGVFLYRSGIDPYSGGVFRHSPLSLAIFSSLSLTSEHISPIIWALLDGIGAWSLIRIWRSRTGSKSGHPSNEGLIAVLYLLNPYVLLPNLALSTASLENALCLTAIAFACQGRASASLLFLALLTHTSLPNIILTPPIILLLTHPNGPTSSLDLSQSTSPTEGAAASDIGPKVRSRRIALAIEFAIYWFALALISTFVAGGFQWTGRTLGAWLSLPDLTPNPGLWWYFFTEMFDHFRPFYLVVFSMHLLIYIVPICTKFRHDPLYATFLLCGILATFKAYPTLADPGLFISMFAIFPEIFPYLRHPIVTILLHMHAALLLPLFHSLWLSQGTGNANFYYATTLVFGIGMAATVIDAVWAGLRLGFGPKREGWEMIQI